MTRMKLTIILFVGLFLFVSGIVLIPVLRKIIDSEIASSLPIRDPASASASDDSNAIFRAWTDVPVPIFVKFRLFHVVNPSEIFAGEKPLLLEKGPYVYSEKRHKQNVTFHDDGESVSYRENRVFSFEPDLSDGDESDIIRLPNFPFLTVLQETTGLPFYERTPLELIFWQTKSSLFEERTVEQWLWGYPVPLLIELKKIKPDLIPFTDFGWFLNKNESDDGEYLVRTGLGGVDEEATILSWNNRSALNVWRTPYCNAINGTDGTFYHPFISREDTLYLYSTDICRSIHLNFESDTSVHGIPGYRFVVPVNVFANTSVNPGNLCFCTPDDAHCLGAGVLNLSSCQMGAPVISSLPHLYQADEEYQSRILGLHPNREEHETYLKMEPWTGTVMDAAKRLQVNAFVKNHPVWSKYFQKFPDDLILPMVWIEETAALDEDSAGQLKSRVTTPLLMMTIAELCLMIVGAGLVAFVVFFSTRWRLLSPSKKSDDIDPLIQNLPDVDAAINSCRT